MAVFAGFVVCLVIFHWVPAVVILMGVCMRLTFVLGHN